MSRQKITSQKRWLFIIVCLLISNTVISQNLDELKLSKGIDFSGSVNLNGIGYLTHGIEQRRDPFNWFLIGNLNMNLFGYNAPFSFSYSNLNTSYTQPFNQVNFAPQYKNVKAYFGSSSMTFSNYTLAGHVFFGGGIEVSPGNWSVAVMYGRLRKAVEFNPTDSLQQNNASYKRMGYGLKIGYEKNGNSLSSSFFTAQDDDSSLPFLLPGSDLKPMRNVAISLSGRKSFLKRFFIDAEYALSVMNLNTQSNISEKDSVAHKPTDNLIKRLLPENSTKRYYDAFNSSVGYQGNWYSIQLRYERVAPEYQTLGAYYFNNDLQNTTIIPSLRVLKNTLQVSGNVGFQRNNLDKIRASTTKRFVSSVNANYLPNEKWNFTISYSNFSSFTNIKPLADPNFQNKLDTLNFYQISKTFSGSVARTLGKKDSPQTIMINSSYQEANNQSGYEGGGQRSAFVSTNFSYSYSIIPTSIVLTVAANIYSTYAANIKTTFYGPTVNISKSFFEKKLRGSFSASYNKTTGSNISTGAILNNRFNLTFTPRDKQRSNSKSNFTFGLNVLGRMHGGNQQPFTELTGNLAYTYNF